jgi:hypothetical protein
MSTALSAKDYYGQPGEFLRYSPSARALALGRAYTAIGQDANALHWNPGALSQLQRKGLSVVGTQASLFGQSKYSALSVGLPFEIIDSAFFQKIDFLTLGFSVLSLSSDISQSTVDGVITGNTLSSSQGAFSTALAASNNIRYIKDFSVGVGVDFIWNNLFGEKTSAAGLTAGLYYHNNDIDILNWFTFALAFKNLNDPNISFNTDLVDEKIPKTGKFGLAFLPPFCSNLPRGLQPLLISIDYDVITPEGVSAGLYVGAEYNLSRLESYLPIRLRLGTNTKESAFTFGLSLDLPANPFMTKGLQYMPVLDYSMNMYSEGDYLGNVKQGGISFAWMPKTPADWYIEGMKDYPSALLSVSGDATAFRKSKSSFQRVFDNPQALFNPNYAAYGYEALLRMGDLSLAQAWADNNRAALLRSSFEDYDRSDKCIDVPVAKVVNDQNTTSLLYRLQAEIKDNRPTREIFAQEYISWIDDAEHVQFLRGYSYFTNGDDTQAIAEWQSCNLPVAKYFLAKVEKNAEKLKEFAFSSNTSLSPKIICPLIPDFELADNALYEYAMLTNSKHWLLTIIKLYPHTDVQHEIKQSI